MLFDTEDEEDLFEVDNDPEELVDASFQVVAARAQADLIGHKEIEKNLLDLFASKRHPHAIIFAGPNGVGKSTMAFRLARYLLKTSEDEYNETMMGSSLFGAPTKEIAKDLSVAANDQVFSKVAASGHPDLLTIERLYDEKKDRRKTEVTVDEIRKIAPFMRKTPAIDGGWRIVIVDDADTMNRNSQNSILKILEEPPEKSLLILVTHRIGALLPTILSRASVQSFYPLSEQEIKTFLARSNPKLQGDNLDLVIDIAEGSLGRSLTLANSENFEVIAQTLDLLTAWPSLDWTKIQYFADSLGKGATPGSQQAFQECLLWLSGSILKSKASDKPVFKAFDRFSSLANQVSLAGWLQICDLLREHFTRVQVGTLDKKFMVMGAFTIFENNA